MALFFRMLVGLYPPGFRRSVGRDLVRTLLDGARAARREGRGARFVAANTAACLRDAAIEWGAALAALWDVGRREVATMDGWKAWKVSLRGLVRRPGYSVPVLVTLALGVGANVAMFTVLNSVVLRDLPYPDADRLVSLRPADVSEGLDPSAFSLPDARDWEERSTSLAAMGAWSTLPGGTVYTGGENAEELEAAFVTAGFFTALGVPPLHGRLPTAEDEFGDNRVVVVSHRFFQRALGGDRSRVGGTIPISDELWRVAAVMPPDFAFPTPEVQAWLFLTTIRPQEIPLENRGVRLLNAVGRLEAGVSLEEGTDELTALASALADEYPEDNEDLRGVILTPLSESVVGDVDTALMILMAAALLILTIACANVANLALAREARRSAELAVRAALGAGASTRIAIVLRESLALSLLGGLLGLGLAVQGTRWLAASAGTTLPRAHEVSPDAGVVAFALLASVLTGIAFALVPGLRAGREDLAARLRTSGRGSATGRMRGALVVSQISLSVVLTVGAFLLVRSLDRMGSVDVGFEPDGVVVATMTFPSSRYPDSDDYLIRFDETIRSFEAIPGVRAVGSIRRFPFRGDGESWPWSLPGAPPSEDERFARVLQVDGDVFEAMGTRFIEGSGFEDGLPAESWVVVVSESLARSAFPNGPALGRAIRIGSIDLEIVGVVEDIRQSAIRDEGTETIYVRNVTNSRRGAAFVVRSAGDPTATIAAVRARIQEADPGQPITELATAREIVDGELSRPGFFATLLAAFAILAVALASVGVYGVVAYGVSQRRREVGIRLAIGADAGRIRTMIVRQGMSPVVLGVVIGLGLAVLASRWMESLLFGIERIDPLSYGAAVLAMCVVGTLACWIPARSASATRPTEAIAAE